MIEISGGVFVGLQVDGTDYPLDAGGFRSVQLVSNCRLQTMSAMIVLLDVAKFFNTKCTIGDGTRLTLQLGKSSNQYNTYNLRVFSAPAKDGLYTITAYYDNYLWFMGLATQAITGTSATAIQALGQTCSIPVVTDTTADSQLWIPGNQRNCTFAQAICSKGFSSDQGMMLLGQSMDGTVRYRDISKIKTTNNMPLFLHTDPPVGVKVPTYQVIDHQFIDTSGFNNARGGYASSLAEQSVSPLQATVHKQVNVNRIAQLININKDIHASIQNSRVEIGLIDVGNVHSNWHRAQYQNGRAKQTFSVGVELFLNQMTTNLDLFDPFQYVPMLAPTGDAPTNDQRNKVTFVVTAKAIRAQLGNYFEKIQGMSQGLAIDPSQAGSLV